MHAPSSAIWICLAAGFVPSKHLCVHRSSWMAYAIFVILATLETPHEALHLAFFGSSGFVSDVDEDEAEEADKLEEMGIELKYKVFCQSEIATEMAGCCHIKCDVGISLEDFARKREQAMSRSSDHGDRLKKYLYVRTWP